MTKLKIKVTKDILEKSKFCTSLHGYNCAIALAIRDIFPKAWVEHEDILPYNDKLFDDKLFDKRIPLPFSAQMFIKRFDMLPPEQRSQMKEFEFEINVPNWAINEINIDELKPLLENHPTLELMNYTKQKQG
jgi:hypothetical protein